MSGFKKLYSFWSINISTDVYDNAASVTRIGRFEFKNSYRGKNRSLELGGTVVHERLKESVFSCNVQKTRNLGGTSMLSS